MFKKYFLCFFLCTFFLLGFSTYKKCEEKYPIKILAHDTKVTFSGNEYLDNNLKFKIKLPFTYIKNKDGPTSVFFKNMQRSKDNISIIFWEKDQNTYEYYLEAFKGKAISKSFFIGSIDNERILSIKEIKREDAQVYLFTTKKDKLFITRIEVFPYQKELQITIVFINTINSEAEAINILNSFQLL